MAWKIFQWGGGRTKIDIKKAELLDLARKSLESGLKIYRESKGRIYMDPEYYSQFLKFLGDAKKLLDQYGDADFISEINRILSEIQRLIDMVQEHQRGIHPLKGDEFKLSFEKKAENILTDIKKLLTSITQTIHGL